MTRPLLALALLAGCTQPWVPPDQVAACEQLGAAVADEAAATTYVPATQIGVTAGLMAVVLRGGLARQECLRRAAAAQPPPPEDLAAEWCAALRRYGGPAEGCE